MWQALSLCTLLCCLTSALDSQNFFYYPYDNLNNIERKHTEDHSPSHPPLSHPITIHPQKSSSALRIVLQQPRPPFHTGHIFVYSIHTYILWVSNTIVIPLSPVAPSFLASSSSRFLVSERSSLLCHDWRISQSPRKDCILDIYIYKYIKKFLYDYDILNA